MKVCGAEVGPVVTGEMVGSVGVATLGVFVSGVVGPSGLMLGAAVVPNVGASIPGVPGAGGTATGD